MAVKVPTYEMSRPGRSAKENFKSPEGVMWVVPRLNVDGGQVYFTAVSVFDLDDTQVGIRILCHTD